MNLFKRGVDRGKKKDPSITFSEDCRRGNPAPWILLGPAFAFFFAILSFTILAEGLKRRMDRRIMRYDYE